MAGAKALRDSDPVGTVLALLYPVNGLEIPQNRKDSGVGPQSAPVSHSTTPERESSSRSPLVNGLIGGLVAVVLSFVPFVSLLGGAIAGYLDGPDLTGGAIAGLVAGVVYGLATVVFLLVFGVFFLGFLGFAGAPMGTGVSVLLFVVVVFGLLYTVGFAIVGGLLGSFLNHEFSDDVGRV